MSRKPSCGEFRTYGESRCWPEAIGGNRSDEMEARHRRFEVRRQDGHTVNAGHGRRKLRADKGQAVQIRTVAGCSDDVLSREAQSGPLAGCETQLRPTGNGPSVHQVAARLYRNASKQSLGHKPTAGWSKVPAHPPRAKCLGQVMDDARGLSKKPGLPGWTDAGHRIEHLLAQRARQFYRLRNIQLSPASHQPYLGSRFMQKDRKVDRRCSSAENGYVLTVKATEVVVGGAMGHQLRGQVLEDRWEMGEGGNANRHHDAAGANCLAIIKRQLKA